MKRLLLALSLLTSAQAAVKLPAIIGDHMLLQRDAPVRIFGMADPGESVTVSYRGQTATTTANALGRWEAWLAPLTPAAPADMTINNLRLTDVLVGDVWVGSGQSNMQWTVQ